MTLAPAAPDVPLPQLPARTSVPHVTAIVVASNGAEFLPRTLAALDAQTRRPDLLLATDAGSTDSTPTLLATATPHVAVLPGPPGASRPADAVRAALALADRTGAVRSGPGRAPYADAVQWLWLLTDDTAPAPDALARLLAETETSPSVAVAGCKRVLWDDDQRLLDVGVTTSRLGARITGLDRGEVDQSQHDERRDVLAVSGAGMLVRRDVWTALGGFDPALSGARADLDLCRRVHLAGSRVVVVPAAVVACADAARTGRRPGAADWYRDDRRDALHMRLATVRGRLAPAVLVWSVLAALARAVGWLVLERPDRAGAEPAALAAVLARPAALWRSRRAHSRARRVPRGTLHRLRATRRQLWRQRIDEVGAWVVPGRRRRLLALDGSAGSDDVAPDRPGRMRRLAGALPVTGVALAAGTATQWHLVGGAGVPAGPYLLPAPDSAARLWEAAASTWRGTGLGVAAPADPFAALLALASVPLGGDPRHAVAVLLVCGPGLAALTAWTAAGAVTRSRALRTWAALGWAAAAPLLIASVQGRPAAVLAHVLLPLLALALGRALGVGARRAAPLDAPDHAPHHDGPSIGAGACAGLLATAVLAAAPALTVPLAVSVAVAAACAPRAAREPVGAGRTGSVPVLPVVTALLVPAVLLLPWWVHVAGAPRSLLADPALADATGPASAASLALPFVLPVADRAGALLLGGLAVTLAALVTAAVAGLLGRGPAGRLALAGWVAALAGFATVAVADHLPLGRDVSGDGVLYGGHGPGVPALSLALLGIGAAALVGARGLRRRATRARAVALRAAAAREAAAAAGAPRVRPGRRADLAVRSLPVLLVAAVALGPVLVLAGVAVRGVDLSSGPVTAGAAGGAAAADGVDGAGAVRRVGPDVLPPVAAAEARGPGATRTLVLAVGSRGVRWTLARSVGPRLGDGSAALALGRLRPGAAVADDRVLGPAVAGLLADSGQDVRPRLADLAVGSVLLLPADGAGVPDDAAALVLDASPGLVRVGGGRGGGQDGVLWRVDGASTRPSRVRVLDPAGRRILAVVPSVQPGDGRAGLGAAPVVDTGVAGGPAGRLLVLAERADPGWRARLDGAPLPATTHAGWAQAFMLPARSGNLVVEHAAGLPGPVDGLRLAALVLALLVALPLPSVRRNVAPPAPPPPSRPVPRASLPGAGPGDVSGNGPRTLVRTPRVFDADHPEEGDVAPLLAPPPPRRRRLPALRFGRRP